MSTVSSTGPLASMDISDLPEAERVEVYRVEHRVDGVGPYNYRGRTRYHELLQMGAKHIDDAHPSPWAERNLARDLRWVRHNYSFGFDSRSRAIAWFHGYFAIMHEADFVLARFAVLDQDVVRGRRQLVFCRERAVLLEKECLLGLDDC